MDSDAGKNDDLIKTLNEHLAGKGHDLAIYLSKIYKIIDTEQFFVTEMLVQKLKGQCYEGFPSDGPYIYE